MRQKTTKTTKAMMEWLFLLFTLTSTLVCGPLFSSSPTDSALLKAVMAKSVDSKTKRPLEITSSFSPFQPTYYTVLVFKDAPENTNVQVIWVDALGKKLAEYQSVVQGSKTAALSFNPKQGHLPPGNYEVKVYVDHELARTLPFKVEGEDEKRATTASSYVVNTVTTKKVLPPDNRPENATVEFNPDDIFHLVVQVRDAPKDTTYRATWYAVDVPGLKKNYYLAEAESIVSGSRNLDFSITPSQPWPPGTYRVEIRENKELIKTVQFTVKPQ